jgi:hypothetical protein
MNAIRNIFLVAITACGLLLASGCASTDQQGDVSSIPWDRPQQWEGAGAMGGLTGSRGANGGIGQ